MGASLTPMMQQYIALKEKYSDCLLFFRLGDFYEMFFEDALTASRELEIVLTGRDCGLTERAPMCGVPFHSVTGYINKLINKGYKVAICEQLTDPKESNGLVERDVTRVITPGTVIEEAMLDERRNNFIASIFFQSGVGLAFCDVSTGEFSVAQLSGPELIADELARLSPTEIIANNALFLQEQLAKQLQASFFLQCYDPGFDAKSAANSLTSHFTAMPNSASLQGNPEAQFAAASLLQYLTETQKNALQHINRLEQYSRSKYMCIDPATRRNLELTKPLQFDGSKKSTLLYVLDKTGTAMGGRLLRSWIEQPLQSTAEINVRLDAVEELFTNHPAREALYSALDSMYDIERLCSRIAYGSVNARDCEALRISLERLPAVTEVLTGLKSQELSRILDELDPLEDIHGLLFSAIISDPPLSVKEGGVIKDGYNEEVDSCRSAGKNGKDWIAKLEADERAATGIKNLRVGFNRVFGYYIEVTKSYQHLVPYNYQRKQTLANSERYITPELKQLEESILGAEERCITLEYQLFTEIRRMLLSCIGRLQKNARLLARLDVYCAFAKVAFAGNYCRPLLNTGGGISIKGGRHPVVERSLKDSFVPNNTLLDGDENRLLILTGPNMAGKSTYMRQVALITLLAHIGSFVPAAAADVCIVDRIFTRVGASDNLAVGQSTFMVEMSEMSNILANATQHSLIIVDEIGRGTSTFDGLSIAWAVLEHIADPQKCGAKTLFATHYHELTELEGKLTGVKNYRISVKEIGEDIIFLRRIVRGGADKSFGVQVASLAGLPADIISRAKDILQQLESADINRSLFFDQAQAQESTEQLSMFSSGEDAILNELKMIEIDSLSPMEALKRLYELHLRAKEV